jgi:hypothetical protein
LSLADTTLTVAVRAYYQVTVGRRTAKFWGSGSFVPSLASCGGAVDVQISTTLWADGGVLRSRSRISNLSFPNNCLVTFARYDATPFLSHVLEERLGALAGRIDDRIREANVQVPSP